MAGASVCGGPPDQQLTDWMKPPREAGDSWSGRTAQGCPTCAGRGQSITSSSCARVDGPGRNCSTSDQGQESRQPAVDHQTRSSPIIRPLEQVLSFIQGFWPLAPGAPYSCAASTHSCAARFRIHWRADLTQSETKVQVGYLMCTPEMAREMINLWISLVPSKMVKIFESRCHRSTG